MQETISISTDKYNGLYDITQRIINIITKSKVKNGIVNIYVQGNRY